MLRKPQLICIIVGSLLFSSSCEYDPPPDVNLLPPQGGVYLSGDPLRLQFSEPILEDTLVIRIWPNQKDLEGELLPHLVPVLEHCTPASSPCEGSRLELWDDTMGATLILDPEGPGQPDVPFLLEILPGLSDLAGRETGVSYFFDFQFVPLDSVQRPDDQDETIEFVTGHYVLLATLNDPVPGAVINLVAHIKTLPDNSMALVGAEADPACGTIRFSEDPEVLAIDTSADGFVVFALGWMSVLNEERFLSTYPFDINITQGPLGIDLFGVRMHGKVFDVDGHDRIEGTLSYERAMLSSGVNVFEYPAGSTTFACRYAPPELVPTGSPVLCHDLCGVVTGQCNPPVGFPPAEFCEESED